MILARGPGLEMYTSIVSDVCTAYDCAILLVAPGSHLPRRAIECHPSIPSSLYLCRGHAVVPRIANHHRA